MNENFSKSAGVMAGFSLVDAGTSAAVGGASVSYWHEAVRAGRAPQPVIRKPRFTRWKASDVLDFWKRFAEAGDDDAAAQVVATATKASAAAKAKRAAANSAHPKAAPADAGNSAVLLAGPATKANAVANIMHSQAGGSQ